MIRQLAAWIVLFLSVAFINGCSDNPASIGSGLLNEDQINIIAKDSYTDSLAQSSSYFKHTVPLAGSGRLLIGRNANVEASFLIKFYMPLGDSLSSDLLNDRINVVSAKVLLIRNYTFGDSTAPFDFSVHSILSNWTDKTFTSDSLGSLNFDPADVSSNRTYTGKDTLEFDLDKQLTLSWLKAEADTNIPADNGIYLKSSEISRKVVGFTGPTSNYPMLIVFLEKNGVNWDTLTFAPYSAVCAVSGFPPQVSRENIVVQNSVQLESKLWFDLSSIPKTALINYAELTLNLDTIETIKGSKYTKALAAILLKDSLDNSVDSIGILTIADSGSKYKGDITILVQRWVNGTDNQGILIAPINWGEGVELLSFKGSSSADLSVRPRLKIVYTTKR